jgi:hypothetical protein
MTLAKLNHKGTLVDMFDRIMKLVGYLLVGYFLVAFMTLVVMAIIEARPSFWEIFIGNALLLNVVWFSGTKILKAAKSQEADRTL